MLNRLFSNSKSNIDKNSNGNLVLQNNNINNIMFNSSNNEMLILLGQLGNYDAIQEIITSELSTIRSLHPLFPEFSARIDTKLNKLISNPETDEAFEKYPKMIKGTFEVDYKKYPYMSKNETPWEYAYRTQSKVELKTTAYKEYLGEIEDPFPYVTYTNGMISVIGAPEFPDAIKATIASGDISMPLMIRRIPSLEYGKIIFCNTSLGHSFNINLIIRDDINKTTINITKTDDGDLQNQLIREKLINNFYITKSLQIFINDLESMHFVLKDHDHEHDIFKIAPTLISYFESLLIIEKYIGCHFDTDITNLNPDDIKIALILSSSLENKWRLFNLKFDSGIRCSYDKISETFLHNNDNDIVCETKSLSILLQGVNITTEKLMIIYKNAKINNIESIQKNIKRKRRNILITIKPQVANEFFEKYYRFEGIQIEN